MAHAPIRTRHLAVMMLAGLLLACGGEGPDRPPGELADVRLSWDANRESGVNSPGGGYRVFYSRDRNFQPGDSGVQSKKIPFSDGDGTQAPTSTVVRDLGSGEWFFRVQAFSDLSPPDSVEIPDPAVSEPSDAVKVTIGS